MFSKIITFLTLPLLVGFINAPQHNETPSNTIDLVGSSLYNTSSSNPTPLGYVNESVKVGFDCGLFGSCRMIISRYNNGGWLKSTETPYGSAATYLISQDGFWKVERQAQVGSSGNWTKAFVIDTKAPMLFYEQYKKNNVQVISISWQVAPLDEAPISCRYTYQGNTMNCYNGQVFDGLGDYRVTLTDQAGNSISKTVTVKSASIVGGGNNFTDDGNDFALLAIMIPGLIFMIIMLLTFAQHRKKSRRQKMLMEARANAEAISAYAAPVAPPKTIHIRCANCGCPTTITEKEETTICPACDSIISAQQNQ